MDLAPEVEILTIARSEAIKTAYGDPRPAIDVLKAKVQAEGAAELALARARADAFAAFAGVGSQTGAESSRRAGSRFGSVYRPAGTVPNYASGGTIPNITQAQVDALTRLSTDLMPLSTGRVPVRL